MDNVRATYAFLQASWYDPFMRLVNFPVSSKAERELSTFLRENMDESKTVLELGSGTAANLERIFSLDLKFKSYLGLDFSPDMLRIARRKFQGYPNLEFRERDITTLADVSDRFDIIICTWVLSHLTSPSALVNQARELMNEDGKFFLIFFSQPKWYLRFWAGPLARVLLRSQYLKDEEVGKFKNVRKIHRYSGNMVTVVEIHRAYP